MQHFLLLSICITLNSTSVLGRCVTYLGGETAKRESGTLKVVLGNIYVGTKGVKCRKHYNKIKITTFQAM